MPKTLFSRVLLVFWLLLVAPAFAASPADDGQTRRLLTLTALDRIFVLFSDSVLSQATGEEISADRHFLQQWREAATASFLPDRLEASLVSALDGRMAPSEAESITRFFSTPLGLRITDRETGMSGLESDALTAAIGSGRKLLTTSDTARKSVLTLLADLPSTEISRILVQQTVRASLLGLSLAGRNDGVSPPWPQIDAQVDALEPSLNAQLLDDQQALMAYAYRDLSTEDLNTYLDFLKTGSAQHYYAEVAYALRRILSEGMKHFGETLASRLASVSI